MWLVRGVGGARLGDEERLEPRRLDTVRHERDVLEVAALLAHESHADVGALQVLGELALEVGRLGGDGGRVVRVDLGWGLDLGS